MGPRMKRKYKTKQRTKARRTSSAVASAVERSESCGYDVLNVAQLTSSSSWLDIVNDDSEPDSMDDDQLSLPFEFQYDSDTVHEKNAFLGRMVCGSEDCDSSSEENDDSSTNEKYQTSNVLDYPVSGEGTWHRENTVMGSNCSTPTPPRRNLRSNTRKKASVTSGLSHKFAQKGGVRNLEVSSSDSESVSEDKEDRVKAFLEPTKGVVILVMKVPSAVTIYGKAMIKALSGMVNVYGFDISSENSRFYSMYSSKGMCSFQIKATKYDWHSSTHVKDVEKSLEKLCEPEKVRSVLKAWDISSAVIVLKQFMITTEVDFVQLYYPNVFTSEVMRGEEREMFRMRGFVLTFEEGDAVKMPRNYVSVADAVLKEIEQRGKNRESYHKETGSRVFVYGEQKAGKSTFLRYLVNRVLSVYPKVMYLDCDPGQTEFTPPGCLSLTEVSSPLLGPPFTHLKTPAKLVFFGSVALETPKFFIDCIKELFSYYKEHFSDIPLFINTFGWLKSIGKECLDAISIITNPTFIIELQPFTSEENLCRSPDPNLTHPDKIFVTLQSPHVPDDSSGHHKQNEKSAVRRELAILAYLGRCQLYCEAVKRLNAFIPYKIKASDIVIDCIDHDVGPPYLMQAVNVSFVALCCVDDDNNILVCKKGCSCPKKLKDSKKRGRCVGFGFVRAIDEEKGLLYLVTPEPPEVLADVNALVKGSVHAPSVLFKNQGIYEKPLPHVRCVTKEKMVVSQFTKLAGHNWPN